MNSAQIDFFNCDLCSFMTINEIDMADHLRSNHPLYHKYTDNNHLLQWNLIINYKCYLCAAHVNAENRVDHIANVHCNSNIYKCLFCINYSGNMKNNLFQHQKCKHDFDKCFLTCPICANFVSPVEEDFIAHIRNVHFKRKISFICKNCKFLSENKMDSHTCKIVNTDYVCKFVECKKNCNNPYNLMSHYSNYHFPVLTLYNNCSECDKMFTKKHSLNQHMRDAHDIDEINEEDEETTLRMSCHKCSYETDIKGSFKQHVIKKHPDIFYHCPFKGCRYESDSFWNFSLHVRDKHLSNKVRYYFCFECFYCFTKSNSLIQHMRDKHGIKDFCSKCRTYEEDLEDHIVSEHDWYDDYFNCNMCDEELDNEKELVDHLRVKHSINTVNIT